MLLIALLHTPAAGSRAQLIRIGELVVNKRRSLPPPAGRQRVDLSI